MKKILLGLGSLAAIAAPVAAVVACGEDDKNMVTIKGYDAIDTNDQMASRTLFNKLITDGVVGYSTNAVVEKDGKEQTETNAATFEFGNKNYPTLEKVQDAIKNKFNSVKDVLTTSETKTSKAQIKFTTAVADDAGNGDISLAWSGTYENKDLSNTYITGMQTCSDFKLTSLDFAKMKTEVTKDGANYNYKITIEANDALKTASSSDAKKLFGTLNGADNFIVLTATSTSLAKGWSTSGASTLTSSDTSITTSSVTVSKPVKGTALTQTNWDKFMAFTDNEGAEKIFNDGRGYMKHADKWTNNGITLFLVPEKDLINTLGSYKYHAETTNGNGGVGKVLAENPVPADIIETKSKTPLTGTIKANFYVYQDSAKQWHPFHIYGDKPWASVKGSRIDFNGENLIKNNNYESDLIIALAKLIK